MNFQKIIEEHQIGKYLIVNTREILSTLAEKNKAGEPRFGIVSSFAPAAGRTPVARRNSWKHARTPERSRRRRTPRTYATRWAAS